MSTIRAIRYHDISVGHRVYKHEGKCKLLHGHNYRIHFILEGDPDSVGRVLDFSVIKSRLCQWLEEHWDHKFLLYEKDEETVGIFRKSFLKSLVIVSFNPTAENLAGYLVEKVGPQNLWDTGASLIGVRIEETRKCSASYFLEGKN